MKKELKIKSKFSIFIVRHGEREDHVNPLYKKESPLPHDPNLTDLGKKQAKETGKYLVDSNIGYIYTSPFLRAIETANEILKVLRKDDENHDDENEKKDKNNDEIKDKNNNEIKLKIDWSIAEFISEKTYEKYKIEHKEVFEVNPNFTKLETRSLETLCNNFKYIDDEYKSIYNKKLVTLPDTYDKFRKRTSDMIKHVIKTHKNDGKDVLLVSHGSGCEYLTYGLKDSSPDIYVPYCGLTRGNVTTYYDHDDVHVEVEYQSEDSFLSSSEVVDLESDVPRIQRFIKMRGLK